MRPPIKPWVPAPGGPAAKYYTYGRNGNALPLSEQAPYGQGTATANKKTMGFYGDPWLLPGVELEIQPEDAHALLLEVYPNRLNHIRNPAFTFPFTDTSDSWHVYTGSVRTPADDPFLRDIQHTSLVPPPVAVAPTTHHKGVSDTVVWGKSVKTELHPGLCVRVGSNPEGEFSNIATDTLMQWDGIRWVDTSQQVAQEDGSFEFQLKRGNNTPGEGAASTDWDERDLYIWRDNAGTMEWASVADEYQGPRPPAVVKNLLLAWARTDPTGAGGTPQPPAGAFSGAADGTPFQYVSNTWHEVPRMDRPPFAFDPESGKVSVTGQAEYREHPPVARAAPPWSSTGVMLAPGSEIVYGDYARWDTCAWVGASASDGTSGGDMAGPNWWKFACVTDSRECVYMGALVQSTAGDFTRVEAEVYPQPLPWDIDWDRPGASSHSPDPDPMWDGCANPHHHSRSGWYVMYIVADLLPTSTVAMPFIGLREWARRGTIVTDLCMERWDTVDLLRGPVKGRYNLSRDFYQGDIPMGSRPLTEEPNSHDNLYLDPLPTFNGNMVSRHMSDVVYMGRNPATAMSGYYPQRLTRLKGLLQHIDEWSPIGRSVNIRMTAESPR